MEIATQYARSGDLQIAYQVLGDGPIDVVLVPLFVSAIDAMWDVPQTSRMLQRIATFARLIVWDRRGSGMSDGTPGAASLEEQIDDVRAVLDAVGSEQPVLLSVMEGCALAALFAASRPQSVRALVMLTPTARMTWAPDYDWAMWPAERDAFIDALIENWGRDSTENAWIRNTDPDDAVSRAAFARLQRLSMSPRAAAAAQSMAREVDVRHVLPSIQCPTLVLRRQGEVVLDGRHSRYVADHVPGATYIELPGVGPVFAGDVDGAADEIEQFLTGARRPSVSDRVLATVLFTDIVGSTARAAALGDRSWRALLERHDELVREQVERHRGQFVKSLGDGVLATFDGPSRAISSALAIRDGARRLDLEVRAGLHTGECELLGGGDVGGIAVHLGARISSIAGPGEVLVSSTVRDLIAGSGQTLADRGEHELKGLPGAWRVFAVVP